MLLSRAKQFSRLALLLAPLALGLAACETLQDFSPFDEKKVPLSGDRRSVFPDGVPGVQYNAPPTQPSNSNIELMRPTEQNPEAQNQNTPQAQRGPNNPANNAEDPWAGQRR